ncbi:hypothetical protein ACRQ5D_10295 [Mucilaginibacter sp. P25]|uniref:hypothetical protein n=1 Tax=unclassified Mucilaginibacter TaxID=2617802 RepID=UPI003D67831B
MKVNTANGQEISLKSVDPEDMDDVLVKIEKSFNISLNDTSVNDVQNFGKLCDVVVEKVKKQMMAVPRSRRFTNSVMPSIHHRGMIRIS